MFPNGGAEGVAETKRRVWSVYGRHLNLSSALSEEGAYHTIPGKLSLLFWESISNLNDAMTKLFEHQSNFFQIGFLSVSL